MRRPLGSLLATLLAVTWTSALAARTLQVHADHTITAKLRRVPLRDVAAMLETELGAHVQCSESLAGRPVTVRANRMRPERFLRLLAPQVVTDALVASDPGARNEIVALYLRDAGDPPPSTAIPGISTSAVILLEGDTEQGLMDLPDDIDVVVYNGLVTLRASQQPISLVAYRLAEAAGIPFDLQHAANDLVDVSVAGVPLIDAVRAISPKLRLYVRTDVHTLKIAPLRLVWRAP